MTFIFARLVESICSAYCIMHSHRNISTEAFAAFSRVHRDRSPFIHFVIGSALPGVCSLLASFFQPHSFLTSGRRSYSRRFWPSRFAAPLDASRNIIDLLCFRRYLSSSAAYESSTAEIISSRILKVTSWILHFTSTAG